MLRTNIVLNVIIKTKKHVLNLYFSGNSMTNLLSYCGLTNARTRASEKNLPVLKIVLIQVFHDDFQFISSQNVDVDTFSLSFQISEMTLIFFWWILGSG